MHTAMPLNKPQSWLIGEILLLYILLPGLAYLAVRLMSIPAIALLPPLGIFFTLLLWQQKNFKLRPILQKPKRADLRKIAKSALLFTPAILTLAYLLEPERFMQMPLKRPGLWLMIMFFYPLISVIAQEIIYRVYFYHRYQPLFEARPNLAMTVNATLFAIGHIIFLNPLAITLTFLGGLIFARRYQRTGNLWLVIIEHSYYGLLIFTSGLGIYFFSRAAM